MKMHRRQRLAFIATPKGMRVAHRVQSERRGGNDHRFVLGGLRLSGGRVVLKAVEMGAAYNILRPIQLTESAQFFYRWRTRQAATQFRDRWRLADLHVYDLDFADVLPDDVELPPDQHRGDRPCPQVNSALIGSKDWRLAKSIAQK